MTEFIISRQDSVYFTQFIIFRQDSAQLPEFIIFRQDSVQLTELIIFRQDSGSVDRVHHLQAGFMFCTVSSVLRHEEIFSFMVFRSLSHGFTVFSEYNISADKATID